MRFPKSLFTLTILSIFTVSLLILPGCGESKFELPADQKSKQGVALEDILPEDTMISFSITTLDKTQREKFENLKSFFPNEDYDNLIKSALEDMDMKLSDMGLIYEKDIAPIFSDEFKAIIGISGTFPKISKTDKKNKNQKQEQPDIVLAFTVADPQKAEELLNTAAQNNRNAVSTKVFDFPALDNEKEAMFVAVYKDVVIVSNTENKRFEAVKRVRNNENSILTNEHYKNALKSLPKPNLGIAYINVKKMFEELAKAQDEELPASSFIDALQFEAFAVIAEDDGLKMIVQVGMNPDNKKFNLDRFPYKDPYLYKNLPGENLIIYAEAYGLKDVFEMQTDMLLTKQDDKDDFERIKRLMKSYIGLDLEKDILSWMDKGYAFAIQGNNGLVPGISLYIDASTDPKAAEKTVDVIDTAFQQLVDMAMTDGDPLLEKVLAKKTVKMGETDDELNLVSIDFTALTQEELEEAEISIELFKEPVEIYYGLTKNNLFVFSSKTGLDKTWGKNELTVAENSDVKDSIRYIKGYPFQLSYINIAETVKYADNFIKTMEAVKGESLPKDVAEAYAKAKEYLAPIKYLVGGNKKVENIAEGMLFIKMEKPETEETAEAETSAEITE